MQWRDVVVASGTKHASYNANTVRVGDNGRLRM